MKIFVLTWVLLLMLSFEASSETYELINATNLAKPGCESRCGDLVVPYPFGIGLNSNCSIDPAFDIYCNTSLNPPKAYFAESYRISIKQISDSTLRTSNDVATRCYHPDGTITSSYNIRVDYSNTQCTLSKLNTFTAMGCYDLAWLHSKTKSDPVKSGCMVFCDKEEDVLKGQCSANGCCQSSIPQDISQYRIRFNRINYTNSNYNRKSFNPCTLAFVGEKNAFKFNGATDLKDPKLHQKIIDDVPIVFDWAIGNTSCIEAEKMKGYACLLNSTCVDSKRETGGYRCKCKEGYEGNPYLSPGCQDIDECKYSEKYGCYGDCINTLGSYKCTCPKGYIGDAKIKDGCDRVPKNISISWKSMFGVGVGVGLPAILFLLSVLYFTTQKRKLAKQREKNFEHNGGFLLLDKLKTKGGVGVNSVKLFHVGELKKATDNYAEDKILGRGGNGVVYKGNLLDNRVVAIKKSQKMDEQQREQFINEMVILTQINHQNVVQLLGCCLETDVPLLVYEFVSNDTLDHHIHNRTSGMGRLSWDSRLRIAHESASALAYLHTDARMSIIHRDVKCSNILLDDSYTAKIADFGASRLVPLGHDQVTTLVQGTLGYLDPEYFHTGQLTDKSDVYSFGVVLAELLTGEKPVSVKRCENERNLAIYFVKAKEEDRLLEILECEVVKEATNEQIKETSELVCRCLNQVGRMRPGMKEVTMELEALRKLGKHPGASPSQDKYNEMSSLMMESEPNDLYDNVSLIANSDSTFGEHSSSSTTGMKD